MNQRVIRFRAWDNEKNEFIYWSLGDSNDFWDLINSDENKGANARFTQPQQFTNLKDKNGKEIYEGDILGKEKGFSSLEVSFIDGEFVASNKTLKRIVLWKLDDYEVIGNIMENPELLK